VNFLTPRSVCGSSQEGVVDRRGEGVGDQTGDALRLQCFGDRPHDGKARHAGGVEIAALVVVQLALARDAVERGRGEGQRRQRVGDIGGKRVLDQIVAVGGIECDAGRDRRGESVGDARGFGAEMFARAWIFNRHDVNLLNSMFSGGAGP
jgi:hypothetical protein